MFVTIRLFARLREIVGQGELREELPEGATARTAWLALTSKHPGLAPYETIASCAVNEEYSRFDTKLSDGDEVAFLPPVSGGSLPPEGGSHGVLKGNSCQAADPPSRVGHDALP